MLIVLLEINEGNIVKYHGHENSFEKKINFHGIRVYSFFLINHNYSEQYVMYCITFEFLCSIDIQCPLRYRNKSLEIR
jgi:hypothetical protein